MSEKYVGWFVDWIEEWSQFVRRDNWYTFHPVHLEFEDDRCLGGLEFTIIVLGLGVRVRWNRKETVLSKKLRSQVDEFLKERDEKPVPGREGF